MSKNNNKTVVCLCGGGTGTHILAGTIGANENFTVNIFTRKQEKWTKEITVQSTSENKEIIGKNKWGLTQVTYSSFETRAEAYKNLEKIRDTYSEDAWMFIKKLQ